MQQFFKSCINNSWVMFFAGVFFFGVGSTLGRNEPNALVEILSYGFHVAGAGIVIYVIWKNKLL